MNTTANDRLVADYLESLRTATADLPPAEREELVANIAEHIATMVTELDEPNEASVRTILDRLGDPQVIAAEARGQSGRSVGVGASGPPPPTAPAGPGALEWGGVAMLGIGSYLLPVIGTVAGLVMISMSRWWTTRQKVVAAVLSLVGMVVVPLLGLGLFVARQANPGQPEPVVQYVPAPTAPEPVPSSS